MSIKGNKELVREVYKAFNAVKGDAAKFRAVYEKYIATGYTYHNAAMDRSRDDFMKDLTAFLTAFPDTHFSIDDMVAEGDKVVSRYTFEGTHKGTFMGVPATGKRVVFKGVLIETIAGGKLVEDWEFLDAVALMTQLGLISAAPKK